MDHCMGVSGRGGIGTKRASCWRASVGNTEPAASRYSRLHPLTCTGDWLASDWRKPPITSGSSRPARHFQSRHFWPLIQALPQREAAPGGGGWWERRLCLSIPASLCLSQCSSVHPCLPLSIPLSFSESVRPSLHPSIYAFPCLSIFTLPY